MFDSLGSELVQFVCRILEFFPQSPFVYVQQLTAGKDVNQWIRMAAWFIPFGLILDIFSGWLAAVGIYYIYQIVLRWAKVIE